MLPAPGTAGAAFRIAGAFSGDDLAACPSLKLLSCCAILGAMSTLATSMASPLPSGPVPMCPTCWKEPGTGAEIVALDGSKGSCWDVLGAAFPLKTAASLWKAEVVVVTAL